MSSPDPAMTSQLHSAQVGARQQAVLHTAYAPAHPVPSTSHVQHAASAGQYYPELSTVSTMPPHPAYGAAAGGGGAGPAAAPPSYYEATPSSSYGVSSSSYMVPQGLPAAPGVYSTENSRGPYDLSHGRVYPPADPRRPSGPERLPVGAPSDDVAHGYDARRDGQRFRGPNHAAGGSYYRTHGPPPAPPRAPPRAPPGPPRAPLQRF
jgi:hypothetical protein